MKIISLLKIALNSLKGNKTRSFLTMLGIIIGIAAVVVVISIGQGAKNLILGQITKIGSNNIFVEPGSFKKGQGMTMEKVMEEMTIKTLKYEDGLAIVRDPLVKIVAPMAFGTARVVYKDYDKKVSFLGTTDGVQNIYDVYPIQGRFFTESENKSMAQVAVIGWQIKKDLFSYEDPIGKTIRLKKTNFKVIGVMEERGTIMFQNLDEQIYIPLFTAQKLLLGIDHVNWLLVQTKSEKDINQAVENIRWTLRQQHKINNPEGDLSKDDFKVVSQVETAEIIGTVTTILTILLSTVAAISLVVGGIGIMNIMFVAITERTREIGLRKAIGANNYDILNQFLLEAIMLTLIGGIIGIILGISGSILFAYAFRQMGVNSWPIFISIEAIIIAFSISTLLGLFFGLLPAYQASKKDPIESLRYE